MSHIVGLESGLSWLIRWTPLVLRGGFPVGKWMEIIIWPQADPDASGWPTPTALY